VRARTILSAGLAASVLVALGAAAGAAGAGSGPLTSFSLDGLSFRHPAAWRVQTFDDVSHWNPGGSRTIAYLSPLALSDPCRPVTGGVACTFPIATLPPRGVLVQWSQDGNRPGFGLRSLRGGVRASIGGHPARVKVSRPGPCGAIGGEQTIHALIAAGASSGAGFYDLAVCLRGPGLVRAAGLARAMLASVRIAAP
jgi:hypothetical protein